MRSIFSTTLILTAAALLAASYKSPAANDDAAMQVVSETTTASTTLAATAEQQDAAVNPTAVVSSESQPTTSVQEISRSPELTRATFGDQSTYVELPKTSPPAPPAPEFVSAPLRGCAGGSCGQPAAVGQSYQYQRRGLFRGGFFRRR